MLILRELMKSFDKIYFTKRIVLVIMFTYGQIKIPHRHQLKLNLLFGTSCQNILNQFLAVFVCQGFNFEVRR